ncbi:PREDICTED: protein MRG1-like isoform X1 [Erythranthe guttata]|uniref:protein MRG1-like isoform X1 n=1 Tax=Erythranthe guttata TaxID=4155 RepID=UPI00064DF72C|nr:PREDICTED: protein MRG1-like isoform X1 [Erythranthe guttata]|eukprot:XP_012838734.1 PREDICTED: protein MRG1-like isoform X1 [Erythranthe guttata]
MSSSAATESSTPISGGCDAVNKSVKEEDADSTPFREGEQVLAYHGLCLYDAKVQKVEFHIDVWRYYVHYRGWNKNTQLLLALNRWDEWLGVDCLLKHTEENVRKQKELKEKHAMEKNVNAARLSQDKTKSPIGVRGKKRKQEILEKECTVPSEKLVIIQIPSTLKKQLIDDHECITHLDQLVKLPRSPSVHEILNKYIDYRVKKNGKIPESVGEIVNGLLCYFDKALPSMLLYKHERPQYKEVIADNVSPSSVYGAEHLLRLFVKLPDMLSCMHIETETLTELQQRLNDLLRFLQVNQSSFFNSNYQKSEGFVGAVKKEEK